MPRHEEAIHHQPFMPPPEPPTSRSMFPVFVAMVLGGALLGGGAAYGLKPAEVREVVVTKPGPERIVEHVSPVTVECPKVQIIERVVRAEKVPERKVAPRVRPPTYVLGPPTVRLPQLADEIICPHGSLNGQCR